MATVTSLTAARMLAIEAASVVSGVVTGDDLILTKHDASTINAGNVRGATGSPGISSEEFGDGINDHVPIGVSLDYIGTVAPNSNWLLMTGQTIVDGQTTYATLWSRIPASMKSGSDILLPDTRGKVSVGYNSGDTDFDNVGDTGGEKTHALSIPELASHTHIQDTHNHTQLTHNHSQTAHTHPQPPHNHAQGLHYHGQDPHTHIQDSHNHSANTGTQTLVSTTGSAAVGDNVSGTTGSRTATNQDATINIHGQYATIYDATATNDSTTAVNVTQVAVNVTQVATNQNTGSGTPHNILQPFVVFQKILKVL